jgi:hypothetical protein
LDNCLLRKTEAFGSIIHLPKRATKERTRGIRISISGRQAVSRLFVANAELLAFDVFDAFNVLKGAGCPLDKWAAAAQAHLSVLSLPAATRDHVAEGILVERRYESDRNNPFRARCVASLNSL